jgi:hypothetical protein
MIFWTFSWPNSAECVSQVSSCYMNNFLLTTLSYSRQKICFQCSKFGAGDLWTMMSTEKVRFAVLCKRNASKTWANHLMQFPFNKISPLYGLGFLIPKMHFPPENLMVPSVSALQELMLCFDNLKFWGQFLHTISSTNLWAIFCCQGL